MGDSIKDIFGDGSRGDSFADLNPFKGDPVLGGRGQSKRQPARYPPLSEQEAEPLKQGLLDKTVSGLHYVGSSLDKAFGGRAVRGVLAGKPREALSAIPFSDTLGLTDTADATSGADLLKGYGVDTTKGNWAKRNLLPMAVEIGLDPGSYINPFGAATRAGKLAGGLGHTRGWTREMLTRGFTHTEPALRAAGRTTDEIAHMVNQGLSRNRIAPQGLVDAALKQGIDLKTGAPLRGALGVGLPFRDPAAVFGTGARSQALAGAMDTGIDAIKAAPGVRHLRALFDPDVMRAVHPGVQAAASFAGRPAQEAFQSATRLGEAQLRTKLDDVLKNYQAMPGAENEALRVIRAGTEDASPLFTDPAHWSNDLTRRAGTILPSGDHLATGVRDVDAVRNHILANWSTLQDMAKQVRDFGVTTREGAERLGLSSASLADDYAHYAARRYIGVAPGFGGTQAGRQFPTMHGSNLRRKAPLTNIPGGSEQLNEWAINPALSGAARTMKPDQVALHVYGDMERHLQAMYPAPALRTKAQTDALAAQLKSAQGKSREVANWLSSVPDVHASPGLDAAGKALPAVPYFNPDIVGDLAMRGQRHAKVAGGAEALIHGATRMSRPIGEFQAAGERHVPLGDFLNHGGQSGLTTTIREVPFTDPENLAMTAAGFKDRKHLRTVASNPATAKPAELAMLATLPPGLAAKSQMDEWSGAGVRAYEQMASKGFGPVGALADPVDSLRQLNQHALSEADAAALAKHLQGWVAPSEMQPIAKAMQGAQAVFKNMVYPLWPASHVRNAASAVYNNFLHGTGLGDYADAARIMRRGRVADPARYAHTAGMTPEQAATALKQTAYADAKVYTPVNSFTENVGGRGLGDVGLTQGLRGEQRLVPRAPGAPSERTIGDVLTAKGAWNPLGQAGIGGRHADTFAPLVLGREAGTHIEDFVRMANYLGNVRKGMSSSQAGLKTRGIHFDYQDLTQAEQALKGVIPFYTFMRKNLPYQVKMAATQPNKVLPTLHAMGATNPNDAWRPEYLSSGAAVPIGQEQGGTQRFLSKFGLPLEEAFERFKFRNYDVPGGGSGTTNLPSLGGTGMAFLGAASPYLKGPLEYLTDTQFHTGRKLSDLHSKGIAGGFGLVPEEVAQPLTQLVANSPLARVASTTNTLADPRKGIGIKALNLLTGLRVSDVDLAKQRAIAARKELESQLAIDPRVAEFKNYYAAPGTPVTPDLERQFRLFSRFKADAKAYHAAQEKARGLHGGLRPGL